MGGGKQQLVDTVDQWSNQYKETNMEMFSDRGLLDLINPDDSILVAGPSRLTDSAEYFIVGVCQNVNIQEQSQVQPMKALGSRRHIFAKTNSPASISMQRLMFLGNNLYRVLYKKIKSDALKPIAGSSDDKLVIGGGSYDDSYMLSNLEEDLFRVPFGLGIIYNTTSTARMQLTLAAEYAECCVLQSRAVSMQTGQAITMENVQIMADRIVPFDGFSVTNNTFDGFIKKERDSL